MATEQVESTWRPIADWDGEDGALYDLWLNVWASPRSMGIADAWRAIDCYRKDGQWFDGGGKLYAPYITHWMPVPTRPQIS